MRCISKIAFIGSLLVTILFAGCSAMMSEKDSGPEGSDINYEYMCGCVWLVADSSNSVADLPQDISGPDKAIYFVSGTGSMYVLQRYYKDQSQSEATPVYRHIAEYKYTVDRTTQIITVFNSTADYYIHAERLNDRSMTLCFDRDREQYVAYTRALPSSVEIID